VSMFRTPTSKFIVRVLGFGRCTRWAQNLYWFGHSVKKSLSSARSLALGKDFFKLKNLYRVPDCGTRQSIFICHLSRTLSISLAQWKHRRRALTAVAPPRPTSRAHVGRASVPPRQPCPRRRAIADLVPLYLAPSIPCCRPLVHRGSIVAVLELFALAFFSAASARGQWKSFPLAIILEPPVKI
jgi:hypothetical protein